MSKRILILASSSKRRARILRDCGIEFKILKSRTNELAKEKGDISKIVQLNAKLKASDVARRITKGVILGFDTLVLLNNRIIGKPSNQIEAKRLLKRLSAKKISVYTGISIIDKYNNNSSSGCDKTWLLVKRVKSNQINKHLKYFYTT